MPPKVSPTKSKKKGTRRRKPKVKKVPRFTTEELNEEIDTFLTTYNPYMSENCVEFDRKSKIFKPVYDYRKPVVVIKFTATMKRKKPEDEEIMLKEGDSEPKSERMRNKFNFRSVASQTTNTHPQEQGNQIDPSLFPVLKFKATASKSEITSAYENHEKKKEENDKYSWIKQALRKITKYVGKKPTHFQESSRRYLRLCEKMVDQNLSEANLDFSYYDNPNDEFRPEFGSLLPLWSFSCWLTKGLPVTGIAWSLHFLDLFAVGYRKFKEHEGDEDDLGLIREDGCLCIYSLKGPNFPEKIVECPSAVRCLCFHPGWAHLLAAGCEGGALSVYDLRREKSDAAGVSRTSEQLMHQDSVNQLKWLPDVLPQKFSTVSNDGKILSWQFMLNDLFPFDSVTSLDVKDWPAETPPKGIEIDGTAVGDKTLDNRLQMAGLCMSVHPQDTDLFVVGTESGVIYQCSFDGKRQLESYGDHKHAVRGVHWNPYHARVFLSCSDDMTVRVWDHTMRESVFEFFFEFEVKDACWAPFSSTLFAAISGNAVAYVFDLAVNKKEAIGNYTVYAAKENTCLTTICFHPSKPVLMVGDEKGHVISFKLSPNLRSSLKAMETLELSKFISAEEEKMEKLLAPSKGRIKKEP